MLYLLFSQFIDEISILNLIRYLSFRSVLAILTSLIMCFCLGEKFISCIQVWQKGGQPIRSDGPETHLSKKGTPTMGGLMMLISILTSTVLWADITNHYVLIVIFVMLSYGALGFMDDYLKVSKSNTKGVSGKVKLFIQFLVAFIATTWISVIAKEGTQTHLIFPFFKHLILDLGWFYFVFAAIVITGASNAVNLTDGLDGLAIGPIILVCMCYGLISYITGNAVFAEYLQIHPVPNSGELVIICASIVGAGLGFLWYNAPPAQIFMGDVGSLALGGVIGVMSVITKHELVLAIAGGIFVIEAVSVILQVASFKLRGKRIFLMAPIHHHFEKLGWSETKVVIRFWIISLIFTILGLATLKLR